mmetsp:Transcript_23504/g.41321  ORF Transcript_23504/g.41321 Transcript_23504/m.41321 type:complete len:434 (+) Transcript_23504:144-1445(+)
MDHDLIIGRIKEGSDEAFMREARASVTRSSQFLIENERQKQTHVLQTMVQETTKLKGTRSKLLYHTHINHELQEAAARNEVESAEGYLSQMFRSGTRPNIDSFNGFLQALVNTQDLPKAEFWFQKLRHPALHPELFGLEPNSQTFDVMLQAHAANGSLGQAETYAKDAFNLDFELSNKSYVTLVRVWLDQGEPRRAHRWFATMVAAGFDKPNRALIIDLIKKLADSGNGGSAEHWLAFMAARKHTLDEGIYNFVRERHPFDIIPCQLSGDVAKLGVKGLRLAPALLKPAYLRGEEEHEFVAKTGRVHSVQQKFPGRRSLVASPRWPSGLVDAVREEASRTLPPSLRQHFREVGISQEVVRPQSPRAASAGKTPRQQFMNSTRYATFSQTGTRLSRPAASKPALTGSEDAWTPTWLDLGTPSVPGPTSFLYGAA